jgi:hypothetical protein
LTEQTATDSAPSVEERLAAVLASPETSDKPETEADSQPEAEQAVEGDEAVVEDEVEADTAESEEAEDGQTEDEEGEADTEEAADDADDDGDEQQQLVEVDGEQLTLEEVKLGYLRQADYTRKTQAVAEQRKAVDEERQYYGSALNSILTAVGADVARFEGVDWERAAAENPDQYRQAKAAYEQSVALFNGIRQQTEDFVQRTKQAQDEALKAQAKESIAILKSTIPGWSNDLYAQIGDYAQQELGFKPEEFNNIADHRAISSIWKAMQYDKGRKVATEKTVKVAPTKTLSDKKAAKAKVVHNRHEMQKAKSRLRETGKVDDAVALLVNRMR